MPDVPDSAASDATLPPDDDDLLSPELAAELANEVCDNCGSADTWWRSCKLLCRNCGAIVKSCADL
jgi:hypothetical protein